MLITLQSILPPRSAAGAGAGQGGARVAGLSGWAPSGMPSAVDSSIETGRIGGGIKIDLIAGIIAHVSIHDMLGLDSLAPLPQVQASFKDNQNCASG